MVICEDITAVGMCSNICCGSTHLMGSFRYLISYSDGSLLATTFPLQLLVRPPAMLPESIKALDVQCIFAKGCSMYGTLSDYMDMKLPKVITHITEWLKIKICSGWRVDGRENLMRSICLYSIAITNNLVIFSLCCARLLVDIFVCHLS